MSLERALSPVRDAAPARAPAGDDAAAVDAERAVDAVGRAPDAARAGSSEPTGRTPGAAGAGRVVLALRAVNLLREDCRLEVSFAAAADEPRTAFDDAVRIASVEPLFEALERWLGVSFDVTPLDGATDESPEAGVGEPAPLRLRLAHRSLELPTVLLRLPRRALGFLPPLPEPAAAEIDVRLAPLSALCRLARLSVPADELARLTPGAVLLLPGTFGAGWPVHLVARGIAAAGNLSPESSALELPAGALVREPAAPRGEEVAGGAPRRVDVVLDAPLSWDPVGVLGGAGARRLELPAALADCRVRCLIDGRRRFDGHVAPVGDGHGFFALERAGERAAERTPPDASAGS